MNTSRNHHHIDVTDNKLRKILQSDLPEAPDNQWFTKRVVNRLPERNRWATATVGQWICYALSSIALLAGILLSTHYFVKSNFSPISFATLLTVSLLMAICGAILTIPQLIRILRDK